MDNREKEEKLIAYQKMLKSRQIDETTYNSMVERILTDNEPEFINKKYKKFEKKIISL